LADVQMIAIFLAMSSAAGGGASREVYAPEVDAGRRVTIGAFRNSVMVE